MVAVFSCVSPLPGEMPGDFLLRGVDSGDGGDGADAAVGGHLEAFFGI